MKISKENIKRLILTLTEIHDSLNDGEYFDVQNELTDSAKEEEFILPKKWSLKVENIENAEIIYPYFNKKFRHGWTVGNEKHYKFYLNFDAKEEKASASENKKNDHQEISPKDYIKHIINKDYEYQRGKDN